MVVAHKTKHPYITKEKGVQGGRPIIVGTRIPVSTIIWYKAGKEIYEILSMYPQLSPSQLHDALSYYYDHKKEEAKMNNMYMTKKILLVVSA